MIINNILKKNIRKPQHLIYFYVITRHKGYRLNFRMNPSEIPNSRCAEYKRNEK